MAECYAIMDLMPDDRTAHFLFMFGNDRGTPSKMREVQAQAQALQERWPAATFRFLCSSRTEQILATNLGLTAIFCHQNAFLDEKRYRVIPNARKKFDAVYLARMAPVKRHLLASEIQSLKLIGSHDPEDEDYHKDVTKKLSHAVRVPKINERSIPKHLSEARIGLSLSAESDASFACTEYLLCGLQVVMAGNIRGHDVLFDDSSILITHDTPEAVAAGVKELKNKEADPEQIRLRTIEKMKAHRQVLIDTVQTIYDQESSPHRFADHFKQAFVHKLGVRCTLPIGQQFSRVLRTNSRL